MLTCYFRTLSNFNVEFTWCCPEEAALERAMLGLPQSFFCRFESSNVIYLEFV
jgi:hypothetical protein